MNPRDPSKPLLADPRTLAELAATAWELFSASLFISAIYPDASTAVWPVVLFVASLALSAALGRPLMGRGPVGYWIAGALRGASWIAAVLPIASSGGLRLLGASAVFGIMAALMRRAIYRVFLDKPAGSLDDAQLAGALRERLSESAMLTGLVGGHVMHLFTVAFLRTRSSVNFETWFQVVPVLGVPATLGFSLAVRRATGSMIEALRAGPTGDPSLLARGFNQARALPSVLSVINFLVWFSCTGFGVVRLRPGPETWTFGDALLQLAFASLFAWGVAFYQRSFHRDTVAPALERLRLWTHASLAEPPLPLRRRMLRDFGLPLVFTCTLSLLSSIALFRALGSALTFTDNFNAVVALASAFTVLVLAVGGVVARAASQLSRPMTELAQAADRVASGKLDAAVPEVAGPVEVVGLGESIERMRERLARTIGELEQERGHLEQNVAARTAEVTHALAELKRTQAALIQTERLASIGELVAGVAHEINNPLNAIAGAAGPLEELAPEIRRMLDAYRLAEADLPPARRKSIEALRGQMDLDASLDDLAGITTVIKRAVDRSVKIVQNLKSFSRAAGEAVPADLAVGLDETLMLLAPRMRQADIQIKRRYDEIEPVVCRAGEINQIFMNLLVNAIQAIETAPRSDEPKAITVEVRRDGESALVAVSDSGPGVSPEVASRIFDPFFTTKPRGQGTGLGLSISSDIARKHGGSLALEQGDAGGPTGARFVLRLPAGRRPSRSSLPDDVSTTSDRFGAGAPNRGRGSGKE